MGDILEFPSQQAQGLAFLDREVRQLLGAKGADDDLIEFAAQALTGIYAELTETRQCGFSLQLPPGLSDTDRLSLETQVSQGLENIRRENHGLAINLVAQLVLAKIRLYELERDSVDP